MLPMNMVMYTSISAIPHSLNCMMLKMGAWSKLVSSIRKVKATVHWYPF